MKPHSWEQLTDYSTFRVDWLGGQLCFISKPHKLEFRVMSQCCQSIAVLDFEHNNAKCAECGELFFWLSGSKGVFRESRAWSNLHRTREFNVDWINGVLSALDANPYDTLVESTILYFKVWDYVEKSGI